MRPGPARRNSLWRKDLRRLSSANRVPKKMGAFAPCKSNANPGKYYARLQAKKLSRLLLSYNCSKKKKAPSRNERQGATKGFHYTASASCSATRTDGSLAARMIRANSLLNPSLACASCCT